MEIIFLYFNENNKFNENMQGCLQRNRRIKQLYRWYSQYTSVLSLSFSLCVFFLILWLLIWLPNSICLHFLLLKSLNAKQAQRDAETGNRRCVFSPDRQKVSRKVHLARHQNEGIWFKCTWMHHLLPVLEMPTQNEEQLAFAQKVPWWWDKKNNNNFVLSLHLFILFSVTFSLCHVAVCLLNMNEKA